MESVGSSILLVTGSFFLHAIGLGISQSFGTIYSELLEYFQSGKGETTWIASLNSGLLLACGSVGGILVRNYGCRTVAILGSVVAAVGMTTSMFVPSMYYLYLTYGVVTGIGMGHFYFASEVAVAIGFNERRSTAMAIASMGDGIGTIVMPFLTTFCLEQYGWRGSFLILSGVMLQGIIAGATLSLANVKTAKKGQGNEVNLRMTEVLKIIFSNGKFLLLVFSGAIVALAYFIPYLMLPDYVKGKGLPNDEAAMIITVSGISGITARLVIGLIADTRYVNRFVLSGVVVLLGGASTIGVIYVESIYSWYLIYGAILGAFTGVFAFLQPVLVADLLGTEHLDIAFGMLLLVHGICVFVGPPIAGWISDIYGRYDEAFIYAGCLFSMGGILSIVIPCYKPKSSHDKYDLNIDYNKSQEKSQT